MSGPPREAGPLAGLRVLDLSRVLSGPFATMHLADMGADVVKVEPPGGDETRRFGPPFVEGERGRESVYFLSINRGKRSVELDLKQPEQRRRLVDLACAADVLVSNFRPGVLERLELGAGTLLERNPRLVLCRISGFGPHSARPGYDNVVQALSGVPAMTGPPAGEPYKCGASIADLVAGHNAVQAILAALLQRERTGRGCVVDVGMLDGMLDLLVYHVTGELSAGYSPRRWGNAHPSVHPLRTYATADGHLAVAVGNDPLFARLCQALDLPQLASDPRFRTNPDRVRNRQVLDGVLEPAFAARPTDAHLARMEPLGVPCGPVRSVPQALAEASLLEHPHPQGGGPVATIAPPWHFDGRRCAAIRRAPRLDEHRDEVLADWLGEPT